MSAGLLQVFVELNKGRSSMFCEGSRVRQTPEEGRRTYRPKRCGNNNKDEDNSLKTLNDTLNDKNPFFILANLRKKFVVCFFFFQILTTMKAKLFFILSLILFSFWFLLKKIVSFVLLSKFDQNLLTTTLLKVLNRFLVSVLFPSLIENICVFKISESFKNASLLHRS